MIDGREDILRLNVARFDRLRAIEPDPEKRRLLEILLAEARAELAFLVESEALAAAIRDGRPRADWAARARAKADQCRRAAERYGRRSTSDVFLRLAAAYDAMAEDAGKASDGSRPDTPHRHGKAP